MMAEMYHKSPTSGGCYDSAIPEAASGIPPKAKTAVGGKPRFKGQSKRGRGTKKTPVFAAVQRNGKIRRQVVADVTGKTLKTAIRQIVDPSARILSDEFTAYNGIGQSFAGGHSTVCHGTKEYVRDDIHTNTAESSHALLKRSIVGIYHNVSTEYLHRYLWQSDVMWNTRKMNDGERTIAAIKASEGKRLMYKQSTAN
jgi:transposase-like protein